MHDFIYKRAYQLTEIIIMKIFQKITGPSRIIMLLKSISFKKQRINNVKVLFEESLYMNILYI
jgi:hypothetical protein